MALKRNGRDVFYNNPGSYLGPTSLQSGNFIKGGLRNRNVGAFDQRFSAYGNGALAPNAFILPNKSGSISSYTRASGVIAKDSANLVPAKPMLVSAALSIVATNAQLDKVVQLIASAALSISGSANIAAAVAIQASEVLAIAVNNAQLGGIFSITASSSMTVTSNTNISALAFMIAEAGGPTELSPEGLANAVLDALLADHTNTGTVGEALNSIGAASNPWSADLASNNDPGTFGERVQKLLTKGQFLGLK